MARYTDEDLADYAMRLHAELEAMEGADAFADNAIEVLRRGVANMLGAIATRRMIRDVQPEITEALGRAQAKARDSGRDDPDAT